MKTKSLAISVGLITAALIVACGGKQEKSMKDRVLEGVSDDVDPVAHLVGDVDPVPIEEENTEEPMAAPAEPTTPTDGDVIEGSDGAFLPTLFVLNEVVKGKYKIVTADANATVVKDNVATGEEIRLSPGTYDMIFTSDMVAGDLPLTLRGVEIPSGRRIKRDVKYKVGKITLVTGARCAKSAIKIKQKGATDWLPGKYFTCREIILPAGEYEAIRGKTPISGIQVYDGGIREILIRKQ